MMWNIRKKRTPIRRTRKNNPKKMRTVISSLWDNFKTSNICIIGVPEGEEKEQEIGDLSEKTVKQKFPNLVKEVDIQVQKAQRVPNKKRWKEAHSHHN